MNFFFSRRHFVFMKRMSLIFRTTFHSLGVIIDLIVFGFSDHAHLDEIKQLRHRIVELEGIVRQIKQPYPKRLLPNEMHPNGFVHFRPNPPYTGDTCSTLGPVHDVSLKQERVVYNSNPALNDNKASESNNFNEQLPDPEQAGVNNYVVATYSNDSTSSSCASCSPYLPVHHDMGTNFRYERVSFLKEYINLNWYFFSAAPSRRFQQKVCEMWLHPRGKPFLELVIHMVHPLLIRFLWEIILRHIK